MEKLHVGALPPRSPPPPALPPSPPLLHIMPLLLYFKKTLFPLFPKRSCCFRSRLILSIGPADREFIHRSKFIFNWLGWQRALHVLLDHLLLLLLYLRLCVLYNIVDLAWNTASEERESRRAGRKAGPEYSITFKSKERLSPPHRYIFFLFSRWGELAVNKPAKSSNSIFFFFYFKRKSQL